MELEHWERVVVSLKVQKYTSLSTVVCLKEHQVSFGLILLKILDMLYIILVFVAQDEIRRIRS